MHVCVCVCLLQLLKHGSTAVLWEPDMLQVMEAAERRGLKELNGDAAQALGLLLSQVQPLVVSTHEKHKQTQDIFTATVRSRAQYCAPHIMSCRIIQAQRVSNSHSVFITSTL